ncbi:hypothetical protein CspHIS471_0201150 [Cutaneotrichosporon sp. HIS471]|nr:hypothetical protein CspHIS471_0201150 [Cutaneotrichosporon sp. HIS471]
MPKAPAPRVPKPPKVSKTPNSKAVKANMTTNSKGPASDELPAGCIFVFLEGLAAPYAIPTRHLADAQACANEYKVELQAPDSRTVRLDHLKKAMHTWTKGKEPKPSKKCWECSKDGGECCKTTTKCARCWLMATPCYPPGGIVVGNKANKTMESFLSDPRPRVIASAEPGPSSPTASPPIPEGARVVRLGEMSPDDMINLGQSFEYQTHSTGLDTFFTFTPIKYPNVADAQASPAKMAVDEVPAAGAALTAHSEVLETSD